MHTYDPTDDAYVSKYPTLASGADHQDCDCSQCVEARERLANLLESRLDIAQMKKERQ